MVAGEETGKNTWLETPPPGLGLEIVMPAVVGATMFVAGTIAVNRELLTKVVASALPFQLTTDPETKPVPFTIRLNAGPPGAALVGTSG
jgi:hypothetical protein